MIKFQVFYGKFGCANRRDFDNAIEAGAFFRKMVRELGASITMQRTTGTLFFAASQTHHVHINKR